MPWPCHHTLVKEACCLSLTHAHRHAHLQIVQTSELLKPSHLVHQKLHPLAVAFGALRLGVLGRSAQEVRKVLGQKRKDESKAGEVSSGYGSTFFTTKTAASTRSVMPFVRASHFGVPQPAIKPHNNT